jgi:hypothetical protein
MASEVEILRLYHYGSTRSENMNILFLIRELLADDLHDKITEATDLVFLKKEVNLIFEYLIVRKRLCQLNSLFNDKLSYDETGFLIEDKRFASLDEVEKAWNNKAFL